MNDRVQMGKSKLCLVRRLSTRENSRLLWANLLGFFQGLSMVVVTVLKKRSGRRGGVGAFLKTYKEFGFWVN